MREGRVCEKHHQWCAEGFCRWCEPEQAAPVVATSEKPKQDRFANLQNFRGFHHGKGTLYANGLPVGGVKSIEIQPSDPQEVKWHWYGDTRVIERAMQPTAVPADAPATTSLDGITWMPLSCDGGYLVPHDIAEQIRKDLIDPIVRGYSYSFEIPINAAPRWRSVSPVGSRIYDNMIAMWKRFNEPCRPEPDRPRFYVSPDWLSDTDEEGDADGDT
jgi:hypothetical protein